MTYYLLRRRLALNLNGIEKLKIRGIREERKERVISLHVKEAKVISYCLPSVLYAYQFVNIKIEQEEQFEDNRLSLILVMIDQR